MRTVQEVKEAKEKLANDIFDLIRDFEQNAGGVLIDRINLYRAPTGSPALPFLTLVEIELRL